MAEPVKQTKMSVVGNVTDSYLSLQPDRGELSVPVARQSTKVDLMDALSSLDSRDSVPSLRCHVFNVLEQLSSEEAEKLQQILDNAQIRGSWIAETLGKYGYKVSAASIQRHRRRRTGGGGCSCP